MQKIIKMNCLIKEIFKSPKNFLIFPFAIIGCVFIAIFYAFCPLYMLADFFENELNSILKADSEKDSNGVRVVKYLLGFAFVVFFNFYRAIMSLPLAISYFIASISFTLSSIGNINNNPFAFSV